MIDTQRRPPVEPGGLARYVYLALASLVVLFVVPVVAYAYFNLTRPYLGIDPARHGDLWTVDVADPAGLAYAKGIRHGDRILEVNGVPADEGEEWLAFVNRARITQITVVSPRSGTVSADSLHVSFTDIPVVTTVEAAVETLLAFSFILTAIWLALARPRRWVAMCLALMSGSLAWVLTGLAGASRGLPAALEVEWVGGVFAPALFFHLTFLFPADDSSPKAARLLISLPYIVAAALLGAFLTLKSNADAYVVVRTGILLHIALWSPLACLRLILKYRRPGFTEFRATMRVVSLIASITVAPLLLSVAAEVLGFARAFPQQAALIPVAAVPPTLAIAANRSRLFKFDKFTSRAMVHGALTLVFVAAVGLAAFGIASALHERSALAVAAAVAFVAAIFTPVMFPLRRWAIRWVDRVIYEAVQDYPPAIADFRKRLGACASMQQVAELMPEIAATTLNLEGACFAPQPFTGLSGPVWAKSRGGVELNKTEACVAQVGDRIVGTLLLGPKVSGGAFTEEELEFAHIIAFEGALAILRFVPDAFISISSHELRTPMTVILGFSELLLQQDPPERIRKEWLNHIHSEMLRLSAIVDDTLNVSRIQSGRLKLTLEPVRMHEVIEQALMSTRAMDERHQFVVEASPDTPPVMADRDKVAQVLINLLSNAVKYSPRGGRVTVAARHEPARGRVVISVADQGVGIAPDDQRRLFTTFHRIHRPETEGVRGTGLGLYIVKGLVELMQGEVWFESELNKGTTFHFSLPVSSGAEMEEMSSAQKGAGG